MRKRVLGFLLLIAMVLVGGCLGQASETSVAPTMTEANVSPSTSTPAVPTASPLVPTPTPKEAQPTATDTPVSVLPTATDIPTPDLPPAPIVAHPAPDFTLPDLVGDELRLDDFKGQMVLVNFWATW